MEHRSYPAEPPVNLRAVRKTPPGLDRDGDLDEDTLTDPADDYTPTSAELAGIRPKIGELESLLTEGSDAHIAPAQWGARGWANTATAGLLKLKPKKPELEARAAAAAVSAQQWIGHQTIVIANPKGGEGKTVAALVLGNVVAEHRGGNVVVWDAVDGDGTLAYRAAAAQHGLSVTDLLADIDGLGPGADHAALGTYLRLQPTRAEILVGPAATHEALDGQQCRDVHEVLRRGRELVIVDTGNNRRRSGWLWAVHNAHLLVIPMTYREDSTIVVCRMLDDLHDRGLSSLVANALVVLTVPPSGATEERRTKIHQALEGRGIRNVVEVPFDATLAGGGRLDHARLEQHSLDAWTRVAALASVSLAVSSIEHRHRERPVTQPRSDDDTADRLPAVAGEQPRRRATR